MSRKLRQLPSHHFRHCLEIGTILAAGTFNRPTFVLYAITPIFYWISRGFSKNYNQFLRIFNLRFLVIFLSIIPGMFVFIMVDSFYFEHVTDNELNLVVTPLNFIKYNLNSSNLAEHGIHFRGTHSIINVPLLFNVMALLFVKRLQLINLMKM
jgi:phosphatidylinositol glycan class Z